jgi:ABC-2 type transport system ATP-binding protein
MEVAIEVNQLVHRYGQHLAVDHLSFTAHRGEVIGLLGPNGAGKTTTVRLLNGLFFPQSGTMRVLGLDPIRQGAEIRKQAGVLTETPALYERLTARQNLEFFGTLMGMTAQERSARIQELLAFFDLTLRANDRVGTFSKGMKQRLALARTLLTHPALLFLDEPTAGLDPEAAQQVHDLIAGIRARNGQTVLLCTHNLYDAERLCDRVVIMNHGQLLASGSLDELRAQQAPGVWVTISFLQPADPAGAAGLTQSGCALQVNTQDPLTWKVQISARDGIPAVIDQLVSWRAQIVSVQPRQSSLEEIYFQLQAEHAAHTAKPAGKELSK